MNPIYEFLVCHGVCAPFEIVDRPQEEQGQVETMSEVSSRERERWSVIRDSCARERRSSDVQAASSIGILKRVEREVERVARDQDGELAKKSLGTRASAVDTSDDRSNDGSRAAPIRDGLIEIWLLQLCEKSTQTRNDTRGKSKQKERGPGRRRRGKKVSFDRGRRAKRGGRTDGS